MPGNRKPRERYKDQYKERTGVADADSSSPITSREKVVAAIADLWELKYPISKEHRLGSNILGFVEPYSDELCDAILAPPGGTKEDSALCIQLASEACPVHLLEVFVRLIPQQDENSREPLLNLATVLLRARRGNLPMRERTLTDMAESIDAYSAISGISYDGVMSLLPDITEGEALSIKMVHSRPEMAGMLAERLASGESDGEIFRIIADNPATALGNGSL